MVTSSLLVTVTTIAELGGIFISCAAFLGSLVAQFGNFRLDRLVTGSSHRRYANENGQASTESIVRFVEASYRHLLPVWATSVFFLISLRNVYTVLVLKEWQQHQWLQLGVCTLILAQCVLLRLEPASPKQYTLGLFIAGSASSLTLSIGWTGFQSLQSHGLSQDSLLPLLAINIAAMLISAAIMLRSLRLPRRPDVYWKNHLVDRQYAVSALCRWGPDLKPLGL